MATLIVHRQIANYLKKLPKVQKEKIKTLLRRLEKNPLDDPKAINMAGEWTGYSRIRIGNLRVIYWYDYLLTIICHSGIIINIVLVISIYYIEIRGLTDFILKEETKNAFNHS